MSINRIQQEAKSYTSLQPCVSKCHCRSERCADIFIAGANFALRWISVEDELPTESPYLVKDKYGRIELFKVCDKSLLKALDIEFWRPIEMK